jgi:hypothetical protein
MMMVVVAGFREAKVAGVMVAAGVVAEVEGEEEVKDKEGMQESVHGKRRVNQVVGITIARGDMTGKWQEAEDHRHEWVQENIVS